MDEEISFEDLTGSPQKTEVVGNESEISLEEVSGKPEDKAVTPSAFWVRSDGHTAFPRIDDFMEGVVEKVKAAGEALFYPEKQSPSAPRDHLLAEPSLARGTVKTLGGGFISLAELGAQGWAGILNTAINPFPQTKGSASSFTQGSEETAKMLKGWHELSGAVTGLNLAPEGKQEEAVEGLLAVIPEAGTALGDTAFEKTGSAVAGAGITGIFTLLTLKPSIAGKTLGALKTKGPGSEGILATFDELAAKDPAGASAVAEHVAKGDAEVGEILAQRVEENKGAGEVKQKEIGKKQAEAKLAEAEISYEELVKDAEISYEDLAELAVTEDVAPAKRLANNASGESAASLEAIGRFAQENAVGQYRYKVKADGTIEPLVTVDGVDARAKPGELIVQRGIGDEPFSILDRGDKTKAAAQGMLEEVKSQLHDLANARLEQRRATISDGLGEAVKQGYEDLASDKDIVVGGGGGSGGKPPPGRGVGPEGSRLPVSGYISDVENLSLLGSFQVLNLGKQRGAGLLYLKGKISEYVEQVIRTFAPEALGKEAKIAGATLAKTMAEQMQSDSSYFHRAAARRTFWNKVGEGLSQGFIRDFEKGRVFVDERFDVAAKAYREWNSKIAEQDRKLGIQYESRDNYLYHVFEKADELAAYFTKLHGSKWGDPRYMKERVFDLYDQAIKAGFKPKFTNPEDIMLARQHASDVAKMRIDALRELEIYGVAKRVERGSPRRPDGFSKVPYRAPNGELYWVHENAAAVLHNAFNTESLWTMKGIGGDLFQGAMFLKNTMVPIKLALSAFHPLHVATIDNATGMVRASKKLLIGEIKPLSWMKEMLQAVAYKDLGKETIGQLGSLFGRDPTGGNRLLKVWQGKILDGELTNADRISLQFMVEGGFIPELSSQYRTKALDNFRSAVERKSKTAIWHAPFAALSMMNKPLFEIWIPSLKIASYLKDVGTAIKVDPSLLANPSKRQQALRRLAKSVDNRYGEMAYNTMFWNRWVKDLGVANTLSLGWQMGFLREYGGGTMDIGQVARNRKLEANSPDSAFIQNVKAGKLDRPLFTMFYTTQALVYGGLLTYAFSGKPPAELLDYTHPKTGDQNPDGSDQRLNTMFYPREFVSIAKHVEQQGLVSGLSHLAASKASGVVGQVAEWASGVNSFGQEIRDPDAMPFKQLEQTLVSTLFNLEPISVGATRKGENPLLAFAGFSTAPKYITESDTSAAIRQIYQTYYAKKQIPFEKAQYSKDMGKLKRYYAEGDSEKFSEIFDEMQEKYQLTGLEMRKLEKSIASQEDPNLSMFQNFTWQQQKRLLDKMTEEERAVYIPISSKQHLRFNYEPPESP